MTLTFCAVLRAKAEEAGFPTSMLTTVTFDDGTTMLVRTNGYWFTPVTN